MQLFLKFQKETSISDKTPPWLPRRCLTDGLVPSHGFKHLKYLLSSLGS